MSGKKTLVWAVVLLALAIFYYLYEIEGGQRRQEASRQRERLVPFAIDDATGLTIKRATEVIAAVKREGHWQLTEPLHVPGDDQKYDALVRSMAALRHLRLVQEQPETLAPFGLTTPALVIHVGLKTQTNPVIVRFGTKNPSGSGYYAHIEGRPAVYLVPAVAKDTLDASLHDLRDKTILVFDPATVQEVEIARGGATAVVVHHQDDDRWQMTTPVDAKADDAQVQALLQRLRDVKAQAFIAETPTDLQPYGLHSPVLRLTLTSGQERTVKTLLFGKTDWEEAPATEQDGTQHSLLFGATSADKQGTYVKLAARPTVYLVDHLEAQRIMRTTAFDLRNKKILAFNHAAVQKIRLQYPTSQLVIERHGDSWELSAPEKQAIKQAWKIEDLLDELSTLEYIKIVTETVADNARYGLDTAQAHITLWQQDGTPIGPLVIGKATNMETADAPLVYAHTNTRSPLYAIAADFLTNLPKTPAALTSDH